MSRNFEMFCKSWQEKRVVRLKLKKTSPPPVEIFQTHNPGEFACMFANWGCDTHLVYRKDLPLRGFDDDCRSFLARQMVPTADPGQGYIGDNSNFGRSVLD